MIRIPASRAAAISASPISFGSAYGRPPGRVVQVVELADGRDPGERHLGERRPGQRASSVSGSRRSASSYISSRQVQKLPRPRWVRPRSARWKACEWALAKPGQREPVESLGAGGRRGAPGVTAAIRSPSTSTSTPALGPLAAEPRQLAPVARVTIRRAPRARGSAAPKSSRW